MLVILFQILLEICLDNIDAGKVVWLGLPLLDFIQYVDNFPSLGEVDETD